MTEKPKAKILLRLPAPLMAEIRKEAAYRGVSINAWISWILTEAVPAPEPTTEKGSSDVPPADA